jgi:hypothetical protein
VLVRAGPVVFAARFRSGTLAVITRLLPLVPLGAVLAPMADVELGIGVVCEKLHLRPGMQQ